MYRQGERFEELMSFYYDRLESDGDIDAASIRFKAATILISELERLDEGVELLVVNLDPESVDEESLAGKTLLINGLWVKVHDQ